MIGFLRQSLKFVVFCVACYTVLYALTDYLLNPHEAEGKVFIWGDSQIYRALDLGELGRLSKRQTLSAARHGAGIYDFLAFADSVPRESTVLVALSRPVQVRRKELDRNRSGFSFRSLLALGKEDYSLAEVARIAYRQRKPSRLYKTRTELYPAEATPDDAESLELLTKAHASVPPHLAHKQNLYRLGFDWLRAKDCRLLILGLPYHPVLDELERPTQVGSLTLRFQEQLIEGLGVRTRVIELDDPEALMYDYTHFNERGAKLLSQRLAPHLEEGEAFFEVRFRGGGSPARLQQ